MRIKPHWLVILLGLSGACRAQSGCFPSPVQAVNHSGLQTASGFRVESTLRDPLNDGRWAQVAQCGHPERPTLLVRIQQGTATGSGPLPKAAQTNYETSSQGQPNGSVAIPAQAGVTAGGTVTVIEQSDLVQLQTAGIALSNAAVGDRVKVRVGDQQFVLGTVRGVGVVEIR